MWQDQVRLVADSGDSTLLMPDLPDLQPAPGPALAFAAAHADLHVGTRAYASPLRPAWSTAWKAHSQPVLTDNRLEMGVGTSRAGIEGCSVDSAFLFPVSTRIRRPSPHSGHGGYG
jgi:hypothetical protein